MILGQVFERFVEKSPVSVIVRGLLETILSPQKLDDLFERSTEIQYTKELLFSTVVEMMNEVACGIRPSIHAAYQAKPVFLTKYAIALARKLTASRFAPNVCSCCQTTVCCEGSSRNQNQLEFEQKTIYLA